MKKNIILTILTFFMVTLLIVLGYFAYQTIQGRNNSNAFYYSNLEITEGDFEHIFSIDKITYFSSCNAKAETNTNSAFKISNLYQFTDIAIFINNNSNEFNSKNTLKSVELTDFKYETTPTIGKQSIYYKNLNDFAKPKFVKENIIKDSINFETTSEDKIDYSKPVLYNNCANPITLCYINENLKDNYTLYKNVSNISYNGSLLKMCGIALTSLSCKLNCTIKITNNLDEIYTCPISLNIPLSTDSSTLYDGTLNLTDSTSYNFIKKID